MELKFNGLSEFEKKLFLYFISDIEQDNERELKQNIFMRFVIMLILIENDSYIVQLSIFWCKYITQYNDNF